MGKKLASALYKENIIEAKEPQENAFFFLWFCFFIVLLLLNFIFYSQICMIFNIPTKSKVVIKKYHTISWLMQVIG